MPRSYARQRSHPIHSPNRTGVRIGLDHQAQSLIGAGLEVDAMLERVEGRRREFAVRIRDGDRMVASGMAGPGLPDRGRVVAERSLEASADMPTASTEVSDTS